MSGPASGQLWMAMNLRWQRPTSTRAAVRFAAGNRWGKASPLRRGPRHSAHPEVVRGKPGLYRDSPNPRSPMSRLSPIGGRKGLRPSRQVGSVLSSGKPGLVTMARINDKAYLLGRQYRTSKNLNSRANLHARFSTYKQSWCDWVFSNFRFPERTAILEAGCGTGNLWLENHERINGPWEITLADLSPGMLEQAKANLSECASDFTYVVADIQNLPFRERSFNVVIANHMLYHVPDLKKGLFEVCRVLKPYGILYAATNGENHMRELWDLISDFSGKIIPNDNHDVSFRIENGEALLSEYFPTVEFRRYPDGLLVTEADPLLEYIFSSERVSGPIADQEPEFRKYLRTKMKESGGIRIQKDVGLFRAEL